VTFVGRLIDSAMDRTAGPCQCWAVVAILERSGQLAALRDAHAVTLDGRGLDGRGLVMLVGGEAGGGKTVLLRQFRTELPDGTRVLWGACDPLFTPRPLAPFVDIAAETGGAVRDLVDAGAKPYQVAGP
jgi:predicted ATPase